MVPYELLVARREGDAVFLVNDRWPQRILVSHEFVEVADPDLVQWGEGGITFQLTNGRAVYRVLGGGPPPRTWDCELWEGARDA